MKRRDQLKHASPDGLASGHIEPAVCASGTICLAADIDRPQPDLCAGISVLDLPGIIPFIWREQADEPEVRPIVADRSWIPPTPASDRGLRMGAAVVSVLLHTSVLLFFVGKLTPRASIGVEVISVVLGADAEAGLAPTPSRSRLAHSAGIASLDQEVQAMVRRASPFPAPPAGHAMTFTVPVSFQLR
jgi:hypothetical protein